MFKTKAILKKNYICFQSPNLYLIINSNTIFGVLTFWVENKTFVTLISEHPIQQRRVILRKLHKRCTLVLYTNIESLGVYRNLDLSDKAFDYLLMARTQVQFVDRKAFFLFVGDVNAHHEEWLGSSTTNLYNRAAGDFALCSGCKQMVTEPTHIEGGVLELVLTDVPDVITADWLASWFLRS